MIRIMVFRALLSDVFTFPNPVNEVAARTVAAGVVVMALATIFTGEHFFVLFLLYGFMARTASGPRFSPLGQLATKFIVPKLNIEPKMVAGPPKRFAQSIGFIFSVAATTAFFVAGSPLIGNTILAILALFALLESALAFCAGCKIFSILIKLGIVPEAVCLECSDIWSREKTPVLRSK